MWGGVSLLDGWPHLGGSTGVVVLIPVCGFGLPSPGGRTWELLTEVGAGANPLLHLLQVAVVPLRGQMRMRDRWSTLYFFVLDYIAELQSCTR